MRIPSLGEDIDALRDAVRRFAEAETIARADLPPDEAAANVAYLKQMLARKDQPRTAARAKPPVVAHDLSD